MMLFNVIHNNVILLCCSIQMSCIYILEYVYIHQYEIRVYMSFVSLVCAQCGHCCNFTATTEAFGDSTELLVSLRLTVSGVL